MEFGKLKCKIIATLSEEYNRKNKKNISKILKLIKEDENFKEMYLFYEDFENLTIKNPKQYLTILEDVLSKKIELIKETSEKIEKLIPKDIEYEYNNIYENLDLLTTKINLNNIINKSDSIQLLETHLLSNKDNIIEETKEVFTENENLLKAILVNNFNVLYEKNLNEEEKKIFKEIVNISKNDLKEKYEILKEDILNKLNIIIEENDDSFLHSKINEVKNEVLFNNEVNKLNYLKLKQLSNDII